MAKGKNSPRCFMKSLKTEVTPVLESHSCISPCQSRDAAERPKAQSKSNYTDKPVTTGFDFCKEVNVQGSGCTSAICFLKVVQVISHMLPISFWQQNSRSLDGRGIQQAGPHTATETSRAEKIQDNLSFPFRTKCF